jgi:hypothetical protein
MRQKLFDMNFRLSCLIAFLLIAAIPRYAMGQKTLMEGTLTYNVTIESPAADGEKKEYKGTYTIIIKGGQIRKDFKLNGGYQDILIYNTDANTIYSLKSASDKKFAIQLSYDDFMEKQNQYKDFLMREEDGKKKIAGYAAKVAKVAYRDGSSATIYYTSEWIPAAEYTFERFPGIKVLPLDFVITNPDGIDMHFHAEKIETKPVENAYFRLPSDYKIIKYSEYKQLNK